MTEVVLPSLHLYSSLSIIWSRSIGFARTSAMFTTSSLCGTAILRRSSWVSIERYPSASALWPIECNMVSTERFTGAVSAGSVPVACNMCASGLSMLGIVARTISLSGWFIIFPLKKKLGNSELLVRLNFFDL